MSDNQNHKDLAPEGPAADDSTTEMDIIKQALGRDPSDSASGEIFSEDLFGEPAKPEPLPPPPPPAPVKESAKVPPPPREEKAISSPRASDADREITSPTLHLPMVIPQPPAPPQPPPPPPTPAPLAAPVNSIKIVTDDDLRGLFDMSSPGQSPVPPAPAPPAAPVPPAAPAPAEIPEPAERVGETVEEIELPKAEPVAEPPAPAALAHEVLDDVSEDEIIDQLETRAQVGEMTAVAAGKKGQLLERTRELMSGLEPAGQDMMSVEELRKLFNNVNILVQLAQETAERVDQLEDLVLKLTKDREGY